MTTEQALNPEMLAALKASATELKRLRALHLPQYLGKMGEPSKAVLDQVSAAIEAAS